MKNNKPAAKKAAVKSAPHKKTAAAKKPAAAKPAAKAKPAPQAHEPLTKAEIAELAANLNEMKTDLAKNVEDKKQFDMVEDDGGDSIDLATRSLDKEILFELSDNERKMLGDIEAALRKMEKGTFGLCEHCKKPIEKKRIKAIPSARYCMACQNGTELHRRAQ